MRIQKLGAEACAAFVLVLAGCGAIAVDGMHHAFGALGIALTFGLAVMVMICATGHISGAHMNPAVALAFAAIGRLRWREVPGSIVAQCIGALLTALCLRAMLGADAGIGVTAPAATSAQAFVAEFVATGVVMFVVTSVATDARAVGQLASIAIGAWITVAALVFGPLSGASLNPARSLGPALATGDLTHLPVYLAAPTLGALLGATAYQLIRCERPLPAPQPGAGCCD